MNKNQKRGQTGRNSKNDPKQKQNTVKRGTDNKSYDSSKKSSLIDEEVDEATNTDNKRSITRK